MAIISDGGGGGVGVGGGRRRGGSAKMAWRSDLHFSSFLSDCVYSSV